MFLDSEFFFQYLYWIVNNFYCRMSATKSRICSKWNRLKIINVDCSLGNQSENVIFREIWGKLPKNADIYGKTILYEMYFVCLHCYLTNNYIRYWIKWVLYLLFYKEWFTSMLTLIKKVLSTLRNYILKSIDFI